MKGTATGAWEGTPVPLKTIQVPPVDRVKPFLPAGALPAPDVVAGVAGILQQVREEGDAAVRALTARFDGVDLSPDAWELPRAAWDEALLRLPVPLREALELAVLRVETYHRHQVETGFMLREADGTLLGMRVQPLDRVGLYVPGGKASYPSSVIMNAVPARVAGVTEIIAVMPPAGVTDAVLAACALAGVTRVFRIGGAQAVAALAYGTETIPRVDKVVGPGNKWVAEAKRQVVGVVGIDMIAGPTEVLILADDSADTAHTACDLIAQAEHDEDASCWCVTTSPDLAAALPAALGRALATAPRASIARTALERNGVLVVAGTLAAAIEVANARAAEHLEIVTREPERVLEQIRHAGAVFLGHHTPEPVGDYVAGPSHVLPTGGTARFASPLGVYDFVTRTSVVQYSRERLAMDSGAIIALATAEGLEGHAEAVRVRGPRTASP